MSDKKIYLHIGMAKCASTSLQQYFHDCDDIDYVGFIPDKRDGLFWENEKFAELFDRVLRFSCSDILYWKAVIDDYITQSNKKTIVFSSENITLRFLPWDLPTHIKLAFIQKIFPTNTKFIFVYKNPLNTLISLHKEWLMMGYNKKFDEFCNELYQYKEISLFNDLLINKFLMAFNELFKETSLELFFLNQDLLLEISKELNINLTIFGKINPSMSSSEAEIIRKFNLTVNDYTPFFDSIEMHRAYFNLADDDQKYGQARKRLVRKSHLENIKKCDEKSECFIPEKISRWVKLALLEDLVQAKERLNKGAEVNAIDNYIKEITNGKLG